MKTFIYFDGPFPDDVEFFTPGTRYEIIDRFNDNYSNWSHYQAMVIDDNGVTRGPVNVGWPCAYLDDKEWSVVNDQEAP